MGGDLDIFRIIWESGLVVKLVLLILLSCSFLSWMVIFQKRRQFQEVKENNDSFARFYRDSANLREVLKRGQDLPFSPSGLIFRYGYEELLKISEKFSSDDAKVSLRQHFSEFGMDVISRALKRGMNESTEKLEEKLGTLATVGSVTPYIGLFGTVWGIIGSFTGLAQGGASLDAVAPGIAEALVATAVGLFAAIPAVIFYNHYSSRVGSWDSEMSSFEQEFLNMVERSLISNK